MRHPTKVQDNTENADLADETDGPSSQNKLKLVLVSLDIMQYMFYLPVYFTGPLFTFQDFNSQVKKVSLMPILPTLCNDEKTRMYTNRLVKLKSLI